MPSTTTNERLPADEQLDPELWFRAMNAHDRAGVEK
jgi:hypothetical protein